MILTLSIVAACAMSWFSGFFMGRAYERDMKEHHYLPFYYKRLRLAQYLGPWSHRWLLTRGEILQHNADGYDNARSFEGLP